MADVSERFSDTREKPEASDVQVITHNDSDCQQFDKRQKTNEWVTQLLTNLEHFLCWQRRQSGEVG